METEMETGVDGLGFGFRRYRVSGLGFKCAAL